MTLLRFKGLTEYQSEPLSRKIQKPHQC